MLAGMPKHSLILRSCLHWNLPQHLRAPRSTLRGNLQLHLRAPLPRPQNAKAGTKRPRNKDARQMSMPISRTHRKKRCSRSHGEASVRATAPLRSFRLYRLICMPIKNIAASRTRSSCYVSRSISYVSWRCRRVPLVSPRMLIRRAYASLLRQCVTAV